MSDRTLRRRNRTRTVEGIVDRMRAGELSSNLVNLAAYCNSPEARNALSYQKLNDSDPGDYMGDGGGHRIYIPWQFDPWVRGLEDFMECEGKWNSWTDDKHRVYLRASIAAAIYKNEHRLDDKPHQYRRYYRAWPNFKADQDYLDFLVEHVDGDAGELARGMIRLWDPCENPFAVIGGSGLPHRPPNWMPPPWPGIVWIMAAAADCPKGRTDHPVREAISAALVEYALR